MSWAQNEGYRPNTGSAKLRVRFRGGRISRDIFTATQWPRWNFQSCPFDITHYKIED